MPKFALVLERSELICDSTSPFHDEPTFFSNPSGVLYIVACCFKNCFQNTARLDRTGSASVTNNFDPLSHANRSLSWPSGISPTACCHIICMVFSDVPYIHTIHLQSYKPLIYPFTVLYAKYSFLMHSSCKVSLSWFFMRENKSKLTRSDWDDFKFISNRLLSASLRSYIDDRTT